MRGGNDLGTTASKGMEVGPGIPSKSGLCPKAEPGVGPPKGPRLVEAYDQNVNYLRTVFHCGCVAYIGKALFGATRRGGFSVVLLRHCGLVVESLYLYQSALSPFEHWEATPGGKSEALRDGATNQEV